MTANFTLYINAQEMSNDSLEQTLTAIGASDGALSWRKSSPSGIEVTQVIAEHDILYILCRSHSFFEVDSVEAWKADSGSLLWRNRLEGVGSGLVVVNQGVIYISCFAPYGIYALKASDGYLLWSHQFDQDVTHCAASNNVVYIALLPEADADDRGSVIALRANDGVLLWRQHVDREVTAMAVNDECVYIGMTDKTCLEVPHALDALRANDGTILWRHQIKRGLVDDIKLINGIELIYRVNWKDKGTLAVPLKNEIQAKQALARWEALASMITSSSESMLTALHLEEGTLLWEYSGVDLGPVCIADDKVFVVSSSNVYVLHLRTGKLLSKYQFDVPVLDILVDADMLYAIIQNSTTSLKALNISDGTTLWHNYSDSSSRIITFTMGMTPVNRQEKYETERPYHKEIDQFLAEANKVLVRRFFEEALSKGDMNVADELLETNYVSHRNVHLYGLPYGLEGFKSLISRFRSAFPDGHFVRFTVQSHYSEGDLVVANYLWRGTNTGYLGSIPPTGETFSFVENSLIRIGNGKIIETWRSFDGVAAVILQVLSTSPY